MMHKVLSIAFAGVIAVALAAPAMAQQTPPTQTVNAPQSSNNGVSNPVGQNTNVQVNNSYAGMNSFGVGIQCATPYLAAGVYNNNTNVNNGINVGASNNAGSNNSLGATVQLVVPVGGKQQSNCTALSDEIVKQRQLDTQMTLIQRCADFAKAGISLDSRVYPEVAAACGGVHVTATTASTTTTAAAGTQTTTTALVTTPGTQMTSVVTPQAAAQPSVAPPAQAVAMPNLVVFKGSAQSTKTACGSQHIPSAHEVRLLAAWRDSLSRNEFARGAKLAAQYMHEVHGDCTAPIASTQRSGRS